MGKYKTYADLIEIFTAELRQVLVASGADPESQEVTDILNLAKIRFVQDVLKIAVIQDLQKSQGKLFLTPVLTTLSDYQRGLSQSEISALNKKMSLSMQTIAEDIVSIIGQSMTGEEKAEIQNKLLISSNKISDPAE